MKPADNTKNFLHDYLLLISKYQQELLSTGYPDSEINVWELNSATFSAVRFVAVAGIKPEITKYQNVFKLKRRR